MTNRHAIFNRNAFRGLAAVAALGCFQVAHAADVRIPYGNSVEYRQLSQIGHWQPLTGQTPGGAGVIFRRPDVTDVTPKIVDLRLTQSAKDVNVAGTVNVPVGATGKTVPVVAKAAVTGAMYMRGVGAVLGGPLGLTLLGLPLLSHLINGTGEFRVKPENGDLERLVEGNEFDTYCRLEGSFATGWPAFVQSKNNVSSPDFRSSASPKSYVQSNGMCWYGASVTTTRLYDGAVFQADESYVIVPKQSVPIQTAKWLPASMDDIAPYMDTPEAPSLTPEVLREGAGVNVDPFGAAGPQVTTSGPSSVPGATSTTTAQTRVNEGTTTEAAPGTTAPTQPATKTTTTTTTNNVTYNDNKVTTNTTTNTTTNITNNTTNVTNTTGEQETVTEETPAKEEEKSDLCEKNPDILACKKPDLDTPDVEIPKSEKQLTYSEEDTFGGGSCPNNIYSTINGQSIQVYDWAQTCTVVTSYLRPLLLLMGALGALFILIPGRDA